ncbi:hypothetical protein [uncultured Phascolarctobacterium sp.]|uniref:hypothetical protein n=1 Tax=uncultured Phascolarctobacterium sp. TaxID=512296 RepID=UPI0025F37FAC|nr:hypothetical protein [uncultured Phascolarctobacterium sp.]
MSMEMPYFMTNPKWYKEKWVGSDTDGGVEYELTSEAPPKAVESFNEYMDYMENGATVYPNDKEFYFKKNPAWYTFDEKEKMYIITKDAPKEAMDSYWDYISQAKIVQY